MKRTTSTYRFVAVLFGLVLLNILSATIYERIDLTEDQRYTLSETSKDILGPVESPLSIDVFLEGSLPSEFRRLRNETAQLLEEFKTVNPNLNVTFIDPLEVEDAQGLQQEFVQRNMAGAQVEVREGGRITTETVFPWALASYKGRTVKIPLLKNQLGATTEERVNSSLQNLEYAFTDAFNKLVTPKSKKIAILKGNGQLGDRYIADFLRTVGEYYHIAPFTLDSAQTAPQRTLEQLQEFDLVVSAKPSEPFSDNEKYILDQYTMQGGASLWLVDGSHMQRDPQTGLLFAFGLDLNLTDFFFKYGVRVNTNLVKDLYSAPILLASGENREAQYNRYPWFYFPLSTSASDHPVVTNMEAVKFEYASAIDTLPNGIEKTILLSTSPLSQQMGLPQELDMDVEIPKNLRIVNEGPSANEFTAGELPLAVLLEGSFASVYTNRLKPFSLNAPRETSLPTKMMVVSDGDVIKNQLDQDSPLELGFDKWTGTFYGNKEFLLNSVNYLLDDRGLINIRTKEIAVAFLDMPKTAQERTKWQLLNLLLPLALLLLFGLLFQYVRRRRYAR